MEKTALITGASSGIGAELARIHAARGGDLVLVARRQDRLEQLKAELEGEHHVQVRIIPEDLSDEGAPQRIFDLLRSQNIEIDFLMNNAGFGGRGLFHQRDWKQDRDMIQVNIVALSALTRLLLPAMVARKSGKVLNVSSTAALMPGPLQAVYYATKAYVTYFSNALAEELRGTGVTVTALMPGATDTGFAATSGMDATALFDKAVSPRQVAEAGYRGMLNGSLDVITGLSPGQRFATRIMPFLPKKVLLKQVRQMQEVDQ
ncbi:SDR family oxidoreductase [Hyphomonas sp.]|uniref:SDR family NAD(P)-dependent oxidoreductase n=1 Tax=Hyphomonas sp. TaxID=87 RepID=UPI0025BE1DAF|nr:SDR family oxidoreductase [Hyphomonas sp.]MBI1401370.1 SDR family NAD(P)-dependent oxidoreductase [Hyphomonas sp.]